MNNTLIWRKDKHYSASILNLQTNTTHSRRIDLKFAKTSIQIETVFKMYRNDPIFENSCSLVRIILTVLVSFEFDCMINW